MTCPNCQGPVTLAGGAFYERGEFNNETQKYEDEGDAKVYACAPCGVDFAIIKGQENVK